MLTTLNEIRKPNFILISIISFSLIKLTHCQLQISGQSIQNDDEQIDPEEFQDPLFSIDACDGNNLYIDNRYCFNNIIIFGQKNFQLNNFAKNSNEDILIQFTEYTQYGDQFSSRLFYGLTKEGKYFFPNKSSYSNEFNIDIDEDTFYDNELYYLNEIKNSKNLLINIRNTLNKGSQYLFSINSYNFMVELYDLNNDNNNYIIWSFHKFFNIDPDDYFFPFDYELFEIKEKSEYIIVFIPQINIYDEILDVSFMKKFIFQSFDVNAYEEKVSVSYQDFLDNKILNVFFMEDSKTLVVLSINEIFIADPQSNILLEEMQEMMILFTKLFHHF